MARKKAKKKGDAPLPLLLMITFLVLSAIVGLIVLIVPKDSTRISLNNVHFEAFKEETPPPPPPRCPMPPKKTPTYSMPLIAIIIDDMGYHQRLDAQFIKLPYALTFSFLPYGPFTTKYATMAHSLGKDVLVHIPMEPEEKDVNPGPGTLMVHMAPEIMVRTLEKDLGLVPFAIGANNHMGSRFTQDPRSMDIVLMELKSRGLFFIDSRTTAKTVAYREAVLLGVPSLERHVFLDYSPGAAVVEHSLKRLLKLAKVRGYAIAIGHPFPNTLKVLKKYLPIVQKEVKIVPVSHLIQLKREICTNEVWRTGN